MTLTDLAHLAQTAPLVALAIVIAIAVWAFATGRVHSDREFCRLEEENKALHTENGSLHTALAAERQTANASATAVQVTNQVLGALVDLAAERRGIEIPRGRRPQFPSAEDLDL